MTAAPVCRGGRCRTATPHWRTVRHHFACWTADGTLARAHARLRGQLRAAAGRAVAPTAAIIDSQSVRAGDWVPRPTKGYDAAKKIHGRKRHVAVDTCGLLLDILVTPAASRTAGWPSTTSTGPNTARRGCSGRWSA